MGELEKGRENVKQRKKEKKIKTVDDLSDIAKP